MFFLMVKQSIPYCSRHIYDLFISMHLVCAGVIPSCYNFHHHYYIKMYRWFAHGWWNITWNDDFCPLFRPSVWWWTLLFYCVPAAARVGNGGSTVRKEWAEGCNSICLTTVTMAGTCEDAYSKPLQAGRFVIREGVVNWCWTCVCDLLWWWWRRRGRRRRRRWWW